MWYGWEESSGPVHSTDPTDANINPVRAVTMCGKKVNRYGAWRLSQSQPAKVECDLGYNTPTPPPPPHSPSTAHSDTPNQTQGLPAVRAVAVSAGNDYSLAALGDGTVWRWGGGYTNGGASTPIQISGLSNVVALAGYKLALDSSGRVWDISGTSPAAISGLPRIVKISQGSDHFLALDTSGNVWAWGFNTYGQLGNGATSATYQAVPTKVIVSSRSNAAINNVAGIAAGNSFSVAVKSDGTAWAWGAGASGQIGNGLTKNQSLPQKVNVLTTATDVFTSGSTAAVLLGDGTLMTWGSNYEGLLGNNGAVTLSSSPVAVTMPPGMTFASMSSTSDSASFFLALGSDGSVWGWGGNPWGNIGDGSENNIYKTPVRSLMSGVPIPSRC